MKTSSIFLLTGTLLVAASVAILVRVLLEPETVKVAVVQKSEKPVVTIARQSILVTTRDLKQGEFIDASAVRWQATEKQHSSLLYFVKGEDKESVIWGAVVRKNIAQGQALTSNLVVSSGKPGFIAALLKPGYRAITVPTDAVTSNSGLISTGDRVDVILNINQSLVATSNEATNTPFIASQTLLHDVRVLALNSDTYSELTFRSTEKKVGRSQRKYFETVTLEILPVQVEKVIIAKELGSLQLVILGSSEPKLVAEASIDRVVTIDEVTGIYGQLATDRKAQVRSFKGEKLKIYKFRASSEKELSTEQSVTATY